jgi:putative ABC transport system permease protein
MQSMQSLLDDVRQAVRALARRPRLVAAIVLPLALGIGANSAVFGMVDAVLFRPLPVRDANRLVRVYSVYDWSPSELDNSSYPVYVDYRDAAPVFAGLAAFSDPAPVNLSTGGGPAERISCSIVTGNYFEVLGLAAARGRLIASADDAPGASRVAVISDRLWHRRFGADPAVVGAAVRINGREFVVAGVAPAGFVGLDFESTNGVPDLWTPAATIDAVRPEFAEAKPLAERGFQWLNIVGRLAPEATLAHAQTQLDVVAAGRDAVRTNASRRGPPVRALPANDTALDPSGGGRTTRLAWLLFGIVASVLLIACTGAAGLLVARAEERKREMAIRQSIGATRGRIARQLILESVLVAGLSGVIGLGCALWLSNGFVALASSGLLPLAETASPVLGTRVLVFTVVAAALTAIVFGIVPAVGASGVKLAPMLKNDARFVSLIGGRFRLRYAFVVLQVALSTVLVVGTGLLLRTMWNAYRVDLGFDATHLLVGSVDIGKQGYDNERRRQVLDRIVDDVRAVPGVRSAVLARTVPVQSSVMRTAIELDGVDLPPNQEVDLNVVGPDFFAVLGVPVLRGRAFDGSDTERSTPVVVVNQAFVDRYWPGQEAIGKRLAGRGSRAEVIGIVANFKLRNLRETSTPVMFVPAAQFYLSRMTIALRTESDPAAAVGLFRAAVARVDPELPLFDVRTGAEQVDRALARERIVAGLLVTFAFIAVLLAATGFYALFSYLVRLRTREFAIRVALGAGPEALFGLVVGQSAALAAIGIAAGLAAAVLLSGALAHLLFGVAPLDATSFAAAALLLIAVPILASYIPARRAARVDPAAALRYQ